MILNLEEKLQVLPGVSPRRVVREFGSWLCPELVATEGAQELLRAWAVAGCPEADPAHVPYLGDPTIGARVVGALERILAPPVVHHVVTSGLVIGAGIEMVGFSQPNPTGADRFIMAVTASPGESAEEVETITAHEVAHAWLHTSPEPMDHDDLSQAARRARAGDTVDRVEAAFGAELLPEFHRARRRARDRRELQATALARRWGFRGRAAFMASRWKGR